MKTSRLPFPKKSLGQHFLSDPRILRRIVAEAGVENGERVLEIGPGPGGLTRVLLEAGALVWALEADPRMVAHLADQGLAGLRLIQADALDADYRDLARQASGPFRMVANLPYNISGPLLARLLRQREAFVSMTVMLQREVAERLSAPAGHRARGRLSVLAQCFCLVRPLFRVAPGAFRPPPKVESCVVRLDVLPVPPVPVADEALLWAVVRMGFGKRRKMIRNALRNAPGDLDRALHAAHLQGRERAESLHVSEWIALANALASKKEADR